MTKRLKKEKCLVCNKLFFHLNRMFKDRKGKFVCMGCDEGDKKDDKCSDIN